MGLSCEDLMVSSVCNGVRNMEIGSSLAQSVVCFAYCTAAVSSAGRVTSLAIIGRCIDHIGFGGLEVACWPLVPKFAGSNPAEATDF